MTTLAFLCGALVFGAVVFVVAVAVIWHAEPLDGTQPGYRS